MSIYKTRTQQLVMRMQAESVDCCIVNHLTNIRYLSGFTGSHAVLVIEQYHWVIITDGRYTEQVAREVADYDIEIQGKRKALDTLCDVLGDVTSKRVAVESEHVNLSQFEKIKSNIKVKDWVFAEKWIEKLRAIKDETEILAMRKALTISESALQATLQAINEGMTERELAHRLEDEMWQLGAKKESFATIALFGARSSLPHGQPSDVQLKRGDTILMDFGCVVDGYCSDITRMAFFGEPAQEIMEMYGCVHMAHNYVLEHLKPGMSCKDADELARTIIRDAGREHQFMHGLGHGVGLDIHEDPRLSYLSDETLEPGHVVTVEPGVYVADVGGIRIENMAVITNEGCEVLNQSSTDMLVI